MREPVAVEGAAMREGRGPAVGDQLIDRGARASPARSIHQPVQGRHRHGNAVSADALGKGGADRHQPSARFPYPRLRFGKAERRPFGRRAAAACHPLDEAIGEAKRQIKLRIVERPDQIMCGSRFEETAQIGLVVQQHEER